MYIKDLNIRIEREVDIIAKLAHINIVNFIGHV